MNHLINLSFEKFNISALKRRIARYHMTSRSKVTAQGRKQRKEDQPFLKLKSTVKIGQNWILSKFQKIDFFQLLRYHNMV